MKYNEVFLGLREKNNLSQQQVAEKLNMSQRAYAHYEKGEHEPSIEALVTLSNLYNVSVDVLVGKYELPELRDIVSRDRPKRGRKPKTNKEEVSNNENTE